MTAMGARLHRYPPPASPPPLTAELVGEAVVRAAMATGELSLLSYRYEAAITGLVAFRGRWVAFAALLALHQTFDFERLALALGCGATPLRSLSRARAAAWWDEGVVHRLFVDLAEPAQATAIDSLAGLAGNVAALLADRLNLLTVGECL